MYSSIHLRIRHHSLQLTEERNEKKVVKYKIDTWNERGFMNLVWFINLDQIQWRTLDFFLLQGYVFHNLVQAVMPRQPLKKVAEPGWGGGEGSRKGGLRHFFVFLKTSLVNFPDTGYGYPRTWQTSLWQVSEQKKKGGKKRGGGGRGDKGGGGPDSII